MLDEENVCFTLLMMAVDEGRGDDNRAGGDPEALPRLLQRYAVYARDSRGRREHVHGAEWGSNRSTVLTA